MLVIRDAVPEDQQTVIDVTLAAYAQYATEIPPQFWKRYQENVVTTLTDGRSGGRILAERDGTVLGSVLLYPPGGEPHRPGPHTGWPEVRLLAVRPEARRQGVARALMNECLERVRRWNAPGLQLHTMRYMVVAREMYERMGFQRAPELDFEPLPGVTVMGFRLHAAESP